jgi:hypothetical protein
MIELFVPIYLFMTGYSISMIIFFYFLVSFFFILFSVTGASIVSRIGAKHSILLSIPSLILYYLGLKNIGAMPYLFFLLPLLLSLRMILYNYGFHLNYLLHSDKSRRGKEISNLGIIAIIAGALSPFIGGAVIVDKGYGMLFFISTIFLFLSAFVLLATRDKYEKNRISVKTVRDYLSKPSNTWKILSFAGYSIETIIGRIIWPLFMILILFSPKRVGLIVTLSILVSIIAFYTIGRFVDKFDKSKILYLGTFLYFFAWVGRIFSNNTLKIFFIDSYKNISEKILQVSWSAKSYDIAQKEDYFLFIVAREITFNMARVIFLPLLIFVFYLDFYPFLISFTLAALATLLYPFLESR